NKGYEIIDFGVSAEESVDYPDMAQMACEEFLKGGYLLGIVLCGTGIGISMAANKIKGIRCALIQDKFAAKMAKEHNDANFLALGGRMTYKEPPEEMIQEFLDSRFGGDRHQRRVDKIMALEMEYV
ncbi:MAG: RpiB/LacA/LacB family sugar-phosphate isomerase, partial [Spirochaetaceae bacterium]|nr:RpiB/LacA/LacB family sugar-phosphate isomerase [Spirochaetaceae bacterium]